MTTMMPTGFAPWVQDYDLHLSSGGVSPKTREVYARAVRQFCAWLAENHQAINDPSAVERRHVSGWLASLTEQGRAASTRSVRLKALSLFCDWLIAEGDSGMTTNPCAGVDRPKVVAPVIPIPTDAVIAKVLAGCNGQGFVDRRDHALLRLLADAGLRRSEAVGLDVEEIDVAARRAVVVGKGGRRRVVAFSSKTALAVSRYLRTRARHPGAPTSSALFLSTRRADRLGWRMTGGGVANMLTRRCEAVGVEPIHPHALRHAATHALLGMGATEQDVEEQMGWTGGQMVRRYGAALRHGRALDAFDRIMPGDRL
ncbi:site-specific tyrosine recombinase XerD [Phycicoccus ginsengisoli]